MSGRQHRMIGFLLGVLILVASSAGVTIAQESATPESLSPELLLLHQASARLAQTNTFHFAIHIEGDAYIDSQQSIRLIEAEGDVVRPDRVSATFKINVMESMTASISMITIGDQHWATDLVSGKWMIAPEEFSYNPGVLFDNEHGIGPVMTQVPAATIVGTEKVGGRAVTHIQTELPQSLIAGVTSNAMVGEPITIDLWIDSETHDLIRIKMAEPAANGKAHPAVWTLNLSKQGEAIDILAPE